MRDHWITDRPPSPMFPAYTRFNAGEVLADPVSPLGWTTVWTRGVCRGCRAGFITFGMHNPDELTDGPPEPFGTFGGYFYNPLSGVRLFGARLPGGSPDMIDKAYFGDDPTVPPYVPEPWHQNEGNSAKLAAQFARIMTATELPEYDEERERTSAIRAARPALATLDDAGLLRYAASILPAIRDAFARSIYSSLGASVGPGAIEAVLAAVGRPELQMALISGFGDVDTAGIPFGLWDLSRVVRSSPALTAAFDAGVDAVDPAHPELAGPLAAFLAEFGCRGTDEWEIRSPSWEEQPRLVLYQVDRLRRVGDEEDPRRKLARQRAERERATAEVLGLLGDDEEAKGTLLAAQRSAELHLSARERNKHDVMKVINEVRVAFRELGRRMHARGDLVDPDHVFLLLADELDDALEHPELYRDMLVAREREWRELFDLEPPLIVNGTCPPLGTWPRRSRAATEPVAPGTVLTGKPGCAGTARGRARVIRSVMDPTDLEPGEILIAPSTDPSWTPLFVAADAVVVNVGALGSHAVITSRELGIPCVVGCTDATEKIPTGALVEVDGATGTVRVLEV